MATRLAEEIIEYEGSGGGRIIDELVDTEAFVQHSGRDAAVVAGIDTQEADDDLWIDFPELFPDHKVPDVPKLEHERAAMLWLAEAHVRASSSRGTEVRTDLGVPLQMKAAHRVSVDARRWQWRHVLSVKVKRKFHINRLELEGVDSQVALAILSRGRTSSKRFTPAVRRVSARVLAAGMAVTYGFVRSCLNPSDRPSRMQ